MTSLFKVTNYLVSFSHFSISKISFTKLKYRKSSFSDGYISANTDRSFEHKYKENMESIYLLMFMNKARNHYFENICTRAMYGTDSFNVLHLIFNNVAELH